MLLLFDLVSLVLVDPLLSRELICGVVVVRVPVFAGCLFTEVRVDP